MPDAKPWLAVSDSHPRVNVETRLADEYSLLDMCRRLSALRKRSPTLRLRSFLSHPASTGEVFVYESEDR